MSSTLAAVAREEDMLDVNESTLEMLSTSYIGEISYISI